MNEYHQPLLPGYTYHLFSRAVGSEKLFLNADNYLYFLQKLKQHTCPICDLYCYTLIPNHFHLLAKMKEEEVVIRHFEEVKKVAFQSSVHNMSDFIMERFSNFLNGYTKAFNKVNQRKGGLFMDYMKRSIVSLPEDFLNFVWYIHKNAVHHGLTRSIGDWRYDSYSSIMSNGPTALLRKDLLDKFGGKEAFLDFYSRMVEPKKSILDIETVNL